MLTRDQERSIENRGWYSVPAPEHSGFSWFLSADRRFPAGILYPNGHEPFYDSNRPDDLAAEFHGAFNLICQDVGFDIVSVDLARYVKQDMEKRERQKANVNRFNRGHVFDVVRKIKVDKRAVIGPSRIPGVRLQWDDDGEAYSFGGYPHRSSLWSIRRNFDEIDDASFNIVVNSFGWLRPEHFHTLPVRFRFG